MSKSAPEIALVQASERFLGLFFGLQELYTVDGSLIAKQMLNIKKQWTMNSELSNVFIIEGERDACRSLSTTLEAAGLYTQIYASGEEFLESFDPEQQLCGQGCCVLIDVLLPGMTGLELQASLKANQINLPCVFITSKSDTFQCVQAMKAGAVDVLEMPCPEPNLLHSVIEALTRHKQEQQDNRECQRIKERLATLTRRERQILGQLVDVNNGSTVSSEQIADRLFISRRTVEHHRAAIKKKLHARSLLELVDMVRIGGFRV